MNSDSYKYLRFDSAQSTRWASRDEIKQNCSYINLYDEDYPAAGLPILSDGKTAYVDNTDTHSLIFGATGSKKTRLFCMPMINIFAKAGESFIVTDPKGELYAMSSGLVKEKGYKTVVLNFRDIGYGDMWNPLSIPYELWKQGKTDEAGMLLSDVVATIAEPIARNIKDPYWSETAQELAIASLYSLMEAGTPEEINMKSLAQMSSVANMEVIKDDVVKLMAEDSIPYINYKSTVCIEAKITASCICSTLFGMLRMFCVNEKLNKMLSQTTFDLKKIGREKTAVYIIVPDEKTTFHFLVTMFIKQVYEVLIADAQSEKNRQLPVRVNFVLDEFCNIPKIPDMPSMISAARSRNMRFYLVAQSLHQLRGRYEEDADTIKGNCDNWVFLTSKELDLLKEISDLCGSITENNGVPKPLISTSELQRFDKAKGEALIMRGRNYPIITELADISMYEMFGKYPSVPFVKQDDVVTKTFLYKNLLAEIDKLEAIAPFASESHKLDIAKRIYNAEMSSVTEAFPEKKKPARTATISERIDELRRKERGEAPQKSDDAEPAHDEAAVARARRTAIAAAHARIAKLMGEEYALDFFKRERFNEEIPRSSPYDW